MAKKFKKTLALFLAVIMTVSLMGGLTVFAGDDETGEQQPIETVTVTSDPAGGEDPGTPGAPKGETPVDPDAPKGEDPVDPDAPKGEDPVDPDAPKGETPVDPDAPKGETPVDPDAPKGEDPVDPDAPKGETPVDPDAPKGESPQSLLAPLTVPVSGSISVTVKYGSSTITSGKVLLRGTDGTEYLINSASGGAYTRTGLPFDTYQVTAFYINGSKYRYATSTVTISAENASQSKTLNLTEFNVYSHVDVRLNATITIPFITAAGTQKVTFNAIIDPASLYVQLPTPKFPTSDVTTIGGSNYWNRRSDSSAYEYTTATGTSGFQERRYGDSSIKLPGLANLSGFTIFCNLTIDTQDSDWDTWGQYLDASTVYNIQYTPTENVCRGVEGSTKGYDFEIASTITNAVVTTGRFAISKKISNAPTDDAEFTFEVAYSDNGSNYEPLTLTDDDLSSGSAGRIVDGNLVLKHNQTAVFTEMATGFYRITEVAKDGFSVVAGNDGQAGVKTKYVHKQDTNYPTFDFINMKAAATEGTLELTKTVTDLPKAEIPSYTFSLYDSNKYTAENGVVTLNDGVIPNYTITMNGSEFGELNLTKSRLVTAGTYAIIESGAELTDYFLTTTYSPQIVTVPAGGIAEAEVLNVYKEKTPLTPGADAKVSIPVSKTWVNRDKDPNPPAQITYDLYKTVNGVETLVRSQTAGSPWNYTFTDLPTMENGTVITYTIKESVAGYTTQITQPDLSITLPAVSTLVDYKTCAELVIPIDSGIYEGTNFVIGFKGNKDYIVWTENELTESLKQAVLETYIKTLPGYNSNRTVKYIYGFYGVEDLFNMNIAQDASGDRSITFGAKKDWSWLYFGSLSFTTSFPASVTNTYVVPPVTISGTKSWKDSDGQALAANKQPESVTIDLYVVGDDAEAFETATATKTGGWTYSFDELDGTKEYYVKEVGAETVGDKTIVKKANAWYEVTVDGYDITNTLIPPTPVTRDYEAEFTVKKTDGSGAVITGKSATFKLYSDAARETQVGGDYVTDTTAGMVTISGLTSGTYYLVEATAPTGYDPVSTVWIITVTPSVTSSYSSTTNTKTTTTYHNVSTVSPDNGWDAGTKTLTVSNTLTTVSVSGEKKWENVPNNFAIPESVTIDLYVVGDDTEAIKTTTANTGGWTYSFDELDASKSYYVKERGSVTEGDKTYYKTPNAWYEVTITATDDGYDITNTYMDPTPNPDVEIPAAFTIAKVDASGNPITGEGKSAEFTLKKSDNTVYGTYETSTEDGTVQITGLKTGVYTLTETKAPAGYQNVDTVWTITVTESYNTDYDNATNANTKTITYEVASVTVPEGDSLIWDDSDKVLTVHNSLIPLPETITISGEKIWRFPSYQARIMSSTLPYGVELPESVTIKLYKDVEGVKTEVGSAEVKPDTDGNWKFSFENLPYGPDYYVEEDGTVTENGKTILKTDTAWYEVTVDGYDVYNNYVEPEDSITNYTPAEFTINKKNGAGSLITNNPATFTLYDEEIQPTPALLAAATTGSQWSTTNGTVKVTGLLDGHYYTLKETQAPSNYKGVDTTWYIRVELDESDVISTFDKDTNTWTHTYQLVVREITLADGVETDEWNGETKTLTVVNTYIDDDYTPPTTPPIEIPETDPPLGPPEVTEPPVGTDPVEDIEEEDVPRDASPKTGDSTSTLLLWAALGLSFIGIGATALTGKRGKKRS